VPDCAGFVGSVAVAAVDATDVLDRAVPDLSGCAWEGWVVVYRGAELVVVGPLSAVALLRPEVASVGVGVGVGVGLSGEVGRVVVRSAEVLLGSVVAGSVPLAAVRSVGLVVGVPDRDAGVLVGVVGDTVATGVPVGTEAAVAGATSTTMTVAPAAISRRTSSSI
jgi:hypothetical protein